MGIARPLEGGGGSGPRSAGGRHGCPGPLRRGRKLIRPYDTPIRDGFIIHTLFGANLRFLFVFSVRLGKFGHLRARKRVGGGEREAMNAKQEGGDSGR